MVLNISIGKLANTIIAMSAIVIGTVVISMLVTLGIMICSERWEHEYR